MGYFPTSGLATQDISCYFFRPKSLNIFIVYGCCRPSCSREAAVVVAAVVLVFVAMLVVVATTVVVASAVVMVAKVMVAVIFCSKTHEYFLTFHSTRICYFV